MLSISNVSSYFLGRCLFWHEKFTRLEPMLRSSANGWVVIDDKKGDFPPSGSVFTVDKNALRCAEGTVRLFRIGANTRSSSNEEHDHFVALDVQVPLELVDLSKFDDLEVVRRSVVEAGLSDSLVSTPEVIVAMKGRSCARLRLAFDATTKTWRPEDYQSLEKVTVFRLAPNQLLAPRLDGKLYFCPTEVLQSIDIIDWSPDAEFFQRLLRKLKRTGAFQPEGELSDISRRTVERLALALRSGEALGSDSKSIEATRARLGAFVANLDANVNFVQGLVDTLLQSPAIANELRKKSSDKALTLADEIRLELEPRIRAEITSSLSDLAAERDSLTSEVGDIRDAIKVAKQELNLINSDRERQSSALGAQAGAFLSTLSAALDVAKRYGPKLSDRHGLLPPWADPILEMGKPITITELKLSLIDGAEAGGARHYDLLELDVLLRAGEIPVLFGSDPDRLLRIYSRCVTGGNVRRMTVDLATLGIEDIWRHAATGEPTAFALAWGAAVERPHYPVLLNIEDLTAAPINQWFPQLVNLLRAGTKPENLFISATLAETSTAERRITFNCLTHGVPFEVESTAGGVVAAILEEADPKNPPTLRELEGPFLPSCPDQLIGGFSRNILDTGATSLVAQRVVRVLRSACATMDVHSAKEFSIGLAKLLVGKAEELIVDSHLRQSFARLAKRFDVD
jgi:hypothetical protein